MNIELLEKIKKVILEEPKRLDMETGLTCDARFEHQCGTVGCIAGWAVVLSKTENKMEYKNVALDMIKIWGYIASDARKLLGINYDGAEGLFYTSAWPYDLSERYKECERFEDQEGMALVTAERIDRYIADYKLKQGV